ncbi:uncharacterized protein ACNS7B_018435 [Menidia menidia]
MGKNTGTEFILPVLLVTAFCSANVEIRVGIPDVSRPWDEARTYCQEKYVDLVTWDIVDSDWLVQEFGGSGDFWIGLHKEPEQDTWKWINVKTGKGLTGEDVSGNGNWGNLDLLSGDCGTFVLERKSWFRQECSRPLQFICYGDNLVLVTENKTWEDALSHCRKMSTPSQRYDLLSLTSPASAYVRDKISRATSEEVWMGLRFLGDEWWWSDGAELANKEMLPACPSRWERCGTMSKNHKENWITRDCSEKRNFICYHKSTA